jgi:hypothetical protein
VVTVDLAHLVVLVLVGQLILLVVLVQPILALVEAVETQGLLLLFMVVVEAVLVGLLMQ